MGLVNQRSLSDLRGMVRLVAEATVGITDVVEKMHHTILLRHPPLGVSRAASTGGLTGFVYNSIRATTRLVGKTLDAGLSPISELLPKHASLASRDAIVSAINGVYGDHLHESGNPLAIKMKIMHAGQALDIDQPDAGPDDRDIEPQPARLLLYIHGLCLNEGHWTRDGFNHGQALAMELGYTPLYLRYNSGLSIAGNGAVLADMLERLLGNWPNTVSELVLVGHSMGGLLARSACHQAGAADHSWTQYLRKMVFIGTPHHGAPLERGGNRVDRLLEMSPYTKPFTHLGKKRSAGITDLGHGRIGAGQDEFIQLPEGVGCYALAATLGKNPGRSGVRLIGDGLVPLASALGRNKSPQRTLAIPESQQWVEQETGHMDLLGHPGVYAKMREWLQ
jgi:pimeloyl-ACP methyl ester carboxylesterase